MLQLLQSRLIVLIMLLQSLDVRNEFVLFLHDALVMHAMEIPFFTELVIRCTSLVCNFFVILYVYTQLLQSVCQFLVLLVNVWDDCNVFGGELLFLLEFIPFILHTNQTFKY